MGGEERLSFTVTHHATPVLSVQSPGAEGNKHGFEGGRALKLGSAYHLFTSEMVGDPRWVKMRLVHWSSDDRFHWRRVSTLYESSGDYTGEDPRAALWSPMPIYDDPHARWNLFYVAYRAAPDTETAARLHFEGRIWRAVSAVAGPDGLGGPYEDVSVVLEPGANPDPWEGLQGTDSFYPYCAGDRWYALYGSANTETKPIRAWRVGLATAPELAGPWRRCSALNPLTFEPRFIENPIVSRLEDDLYVTVYDTGINADNAIGWAYSRDGLRWARGEPLVAQPDGPARWARLMRTPLGLISEDDGSFTLFYTAYQRDVGAEDGGGELLSGTGAVGLMTLSRRQADGA